MDRFQEMAVFLAMADERSFIAAARRLNVSPPTATRAVTAPVLDRVGSMVGDHTQKPEA